MSERTRRRFLKVGTGALAFGLISSALPQVAEAQGRGPSRPPAETPKPETPPSPVGTAIASVILTAEAAITFGSIATMIWHARRRD